MLTASYYISKHFDGKLSIEKIYEGVPAAALNFVVNYSNADLERFLSFMISVIPDNDISLITNRWQKNLLPELKAWIDFKETLYIIFAFVFLFSIFTFAGVFLIVKSYRKRLEIKGFLEEQLSFMQIIVDSIPHPVYAKNENLEIIISNHQFKTMESAFYRNGLLESELEIINKDYISAMADNSTIVRERNFFLDGSKYHIYHWIQPFTMSNTKGVICGWLDITEKEALLEELSRAKASADSASMAKSQFVAMISHEIRTPINAILGFLEIFIKKNTEHRDHHLVKMALDSATDLSNLIGDILDISKIESGSVVLTPAANDIKGLFKTLQQSYQVMAHKKGVIFDVFIDSNIADVLYFDSAKLM